MNREKLVEKLINIKKQAEKIRKQLDNIDYEERFNIAKQYEGRYFKEVDNYHNGYIRCLFVYSTDKEQCNPMSLSISYWKDNETAYYTIEYYNHFHPKKWDDDIDKWIEITKEEYQLHYDEVQKRISFVLSTNK